MAMFEPQCICLYSQISCIELHNESSWDTGLCSASMAVLKNSDLVVRGVTTLGRHKYHIYDVDGGLVSTMKAGCKHSQATITEFLHGHYLNMLEQETTKFSRGDIMTLGAISGMLVVLLMFYRGILPKTPSMILLCVVMIVFFVAVLVGFFVVGDFFGERVQNYLGIDIQGMNVCLYITVVLPGSILVIDIIIVIFASGDLPVKLSIGGLLLLFCSLLGYTYVCKKRERDGTYLESCSQCKNARIYKAGNRTPLASIKMTLRLFRTVTDGPSLSFFAALSNNIICRHILHSKEIIGEHWFDQVKRRLGKVINEVLHTKKYDVEQYNILFEGDLNILAMCYLPLKEQLVVIDSTMGTVMAFKYKARNNDSESDNQNTESMELGWTLSGEIDGIPFNPQSLTADDLGRLYIADGACNRIILLDATDGSMLQVLLLGDQCTDMLLSIKWRPVQPQLVVMYGSPDNPVRIASFRVE